jgi:hypothetical protein
MYFLLQAFFDNGCPPPPPVTQPNPTQPTAAQKTHPWLREKAGPQILLMYDLISGRSFSKIQN